MKIKKLASKLSYLLPALAVFLGQFNLAYHFCSKFAYVDGYYVNYYDFVVHIVDVVLLGGLLWYLVKFRLWKNIRFKAITVVGLILWAGHNLIFRDWVVFYWSSRLLLYLISGVTIRLGILHLKMTERRMLTNWLFGAVVGVGAFQSILIIIQFFSNRTIGLHFLGESFVQSGISGTSSIVLPFGTFLRGYGTFPHPNVVGGFLGISILIIISRILFGINNKRLYLIAPLVLTVLGLVLTWSRGAWLFTVLSLLLSLYLYLKTREKEIGRKILGILLILVGIAVIWVSISGDSVAISIRERLIEQTIGGDESVIQRRQLNKRAIEMYRDNILTGVGAGKFISRLTNNPVLSEAGLRIMQPSHNIFLLGAAELGFMALWILSYYLYSSIKGLRDNYYYLFPLLFLVTVGSLDHYPITLPQGLLMLLILDWFVILQKSIYARKHFR